MLGTSLFSYLHRACPNLCSLSWVGRSRAQPRPRPSRVRLPGRAPVLTPIPALLLLSPLAEELEQAKNDLKGIVDSGTLFGSVTR